MLKSMSLAFVGSYVAGYPLQRTYDLKCFANISSCHFHSDTNFQHPILQMEKLRSRETEFSIARVKQTANCIDLGCEHKKAGL